MEIFLKNKASTFVRKTVIFEDNYLDMILAYRWIKGRGKWDIRQQLYDTCTLGGEGWIGESVELPRQNQPLNARKITTKRRFTPYSSLLKKNNKSQYLDAKIWSELFTYSAIEEDESLRCRRTWGFNFLR